MGNSLGTGDSNSCMEFIHGGATIGRYIFHNYSYCTGDVHDNIIRPCCVEREVSKGMGAMGSPSKTMLTKKYSVASRLHFSCSLRLLHTGRPMKYCALFLSIFFATTSFTEQAINDTELSGKINIPNKVNYIEIPAKDLAATKAFFVEVFGWSFTDFGPEYSSFNDQGVDGGFFKSDLTVSTSSGSALIVFYSDNLETVQEKVITAGGSVIRPIFSFPGGHRFHFSDPNGNEYAVWSE